MKPKQPSVAKQVVYGQPSWRLASDQVEAYVTELGGHVGPVVFDRSGRKISPYSVAPWAEEKYTPPLIPILRVLRGDFFCMPFGGNEKPYRGEIHPPHGETANERWHFESLETASGKSSLHLSLNTKIRSGRVDKLITVINGENTLYSRHIISGMRGPMNLGHHAMIKFPEAEGSGNVAISRFIFGQVLPVPYESPEAGGYSALKVGAEFTSLSSIPMANGESADASRYPARRGFEDLIMMVSDDSLPFAWTTATFPKERFVWFGLKDPRVLRETVFWITNRGRHYPPWNSRHVGILGMEEVTSYFHMGLAASTAKNHLSSRGIPTCIQLNPKKPLVVNYITGVAPIPAGFDRVQSIEAEKGNKSITLISASGKKAKAKVDLDFLMQ